VRPDCAGYAAGLAEVLPYRDEKSERPLRRGVAFVAVRSDGAVLLRERPPKGLLGGMLEVPSSPWEEAEPNRKSASHHAPLEADWRRLPGLVEHTFTHFQLELSVCRAEVPLDATPKRAADPERCRFVARRDLARAAIPSVMWKVLRHALEAERLSPAAQALRGQLRARRRSA
jgi:A/G-specific adenine glycosylase